MKHHRRPAVLAAIALAALTTAACGKEAPSADSSKTSTASSDAASAIDLEPTTPAAKGDTGPVTWATYREVGTLDPIQAFDYPENTVITALCDSIMQQQPDGTIEPGIAEQVDQPDAQTIVMKLRQGVKFWDGKPVTPEDVVFSLKRNTDTKLGGFYGKVFERVASISATGADEVTLKLSKPDNWLIGELSQMPGIVLQKAYVESKGKDFGTSSGGTMCTGPFELADWKPGTSLEATRNDAYWDADLKPKAASITFKGVSDDSSKTSGLLTNEISGTYDGPLSTYDQLEASPNVTVHDGPSFAADAFIVSSSKGALADQDVRRALSMAIDRKAYIESLYKGHALIPRTLANPGSWGFQRDVFQADWDKLADPGGDVAEAKQLVEQAGATGKEIVIGTSSEVNSLQTAANAVRQAAISIGLKARFKSVSAANFINFFTDPKAREDVDGFLTVNYGDYADPAALYATVAIPGGSQNYSEFEDPRITAAMEEARTTPDEKARAAATAKAGDLIMETLPWIPLAAPKTVIIMDKKLTGAPSSFMYMGGPWAAMLGAADGGT
jgi:peptide/nickel transport system substrate-binding protein